MENRRGPHRIPERDPKVPILSIEVLSALVSGNVLGLDYQMAKLQTRPLANRGRTFVWPK